MVKWRESKSLLQDVHRFPEFCERYLRIQPKGGQKTIPFVLNRVQRWFFDRYIAPKWAADKPVRCAILKARQEGFSTLCQGFNYWVTLGSHNVNNLVISREQDQVMELFRMIHRFDAHMPIGKDLPVFVKALCNKHGIEYKHPPAGKMRRDLLGRDDLVFLDSRIEIRSAMDDENLGRAGSYQVVHASEVAFWKNLTGSLASLLAACSAEAKSAVFLETTANGYNAFHSFWCNLTVGDQEVPTDWERVFVPWYWDRRYELPLTIKRFYVDDAEEDLYRRIVEDPTLRLMDAEVDEDRIWAKLFWRRQQIRDMFFGDVAKFKQEFPAIDSEAFIFNGVSAFAVTHLNRLERHVRPPEKRVHIRLLAAKDPRNPDEQKLEDGIEAPKVLPPSKGRMSRPTYDLEEHERGRLLIYEMPVEGGKYVLFGDSAEGKAAESFGVADEAKSKYDFSCVQVLRVDQFPLVNQVAVWHGTIDPDLFGEVIVALGWMYNEAYCGWEINGPGRSLTLQIVERLRYSNVYLREDMDNFTHRITQKPGWRTTPGTKPDMVATGQRYVRQLALIIRDSATMMEMRAFSRVGQNKFEAAEGHDDRVIALLGCLVVVEPRLEAIRRQIEAEKKIVKAKEKTFDPERDLWGEKPDTPHPILGSEW